MKKVLCLLLALVMVFSLVACGDDTENPNNPVAGDDAQGDVTPDGDNDGDAADADDADDAEANPLGYTITEFDPEATYTQHSSLTSVPGNWNMHDYEDSASSTIFAPLTDSLYDITWNDELHPVEGADPWTAYTILPAMAADMATDVTAEVAAEHPEWIPEGVTSGYAWSIPLREDLYFDTGYHITAQTYVDSVKYLLDPRLQNYRATDFYNGATGIVGAEEYFKGGTYALGEFVSANFGDDEYVDPANFTTTADGTYQYDGKDVVLDINNGGNWGLDGGIATYAGQVEQVDRLIAAANDKGQVFLTADLLKDLQDVVAMLHGYDNVEAYAAEAGDYAYQEFEEMAFFGETWDAVEFEDTVGFYAKDDYTLVMVFKGSVDNGFYLYYNYIGFKANNLIEPDVYESCLAQDESGTWYSTYMTSKETSPSYGPYSMTGYQTEKEVTYSKNDSWYGWTDDVNHVYKDPNDGNVYRTNQTTDIVYTLVKETATRRQMFLSGELNSFNLEETDYEQYGHSEYALDYPSETAAGLWVTGNKEGLQAREAVAGFDKTKEDTETIGLVSFHKALAVSFDRQAFCDECHPAYVPGYGILGDQYIYDVDNGLFYRNSDQAKQVLCDFYSVDTSKFDSLDDAVDSITGFDLDAAKELYQAAYEESLGLGYITDADNDGKCDQTITMLYASPGPADYVTRRINYLNTRLTEATVGTPFEGKLSVVESAPLGDSGWIGAYSSGAADIMIAGVGGSIFDPFGAMSLYCDPNQNLTANWYDPNSDMLTLTVDGSEITMSVFDWYQALNGTQVTVGGQNYSFGSADVDAETRLTVLAGLEGKIMQCYDVLPMCNFGSKALHSQKIFYVLDEYNPIYEYGPSRYNYSDQEWDEYVAEQIAEHGQLQY